MTTKTSLEKAELQLGLEHIRTLLKSKPCDDSIIIKHRYRVKATTYFEYDLFKFAYPDSDARRIDRLECSYFLEHLLDWFGHSFPTQQKYLKIKTWESVTGEDFYAGSLLDSTISREKFFNIVGFFVYGKIYINISHKFDTGKKAKLAMLTELGEECFFLIADYLDAEFGEAYNNNGILPIPKEREYPEYNKRDTINTKFDKFLTTNPAITIEANLDSGKYSVAAFVTDFNSVHNATFAWAVDFLILEMLAAAKYPASTLNALKANVRISENRRVISESKFYQLFGCCVLLILGVTDQEVKLNTLRRLGKLCFLRLVDYLENKKTLTK